MYYIHKVTEVKNHIQFGGKRHNFTPYDYYYDVIILKNCLYKEMSSMESQMVYTTNGKIR